MADNTKPSTEQILELRKEPTDTLLTGVWYSDFNKVKAEAEKTGKPMFAMWINPGCGFCKRFCGNAMTDEFQKWMASSDMYFWLGAAPDKEGRSGAGWDFVIKQSKRDDPKGMHYFPLTAVWQCEKGNPSKVLHDYRASGRFLEQEKTAPAGAPLIIEAIKKALTEPPHEEMKMPDRPANAQGAPNAQQALQRILDVANQALGVKPQAAGSNLGHIRINPALDLDKRMRIMHAIMEKDGHCPCQQDRNGDTVCLCKEFRESGKLGTCKCGLFERY